MNDDITLSIYNYTSDSWINLPNLILEGNVFRDVSNSLVFNNITKAGFVNSTGSNLRIRYTDIGLTDGATSNLDIDYATVSCDRLGSPSWETIRGSSEIHVSKPLNITEISEGVWNYSNKSIDNFNFTVNVNNSEIAKAVWEYSSRNLTYTEDKTNYTFFSSFFNNILNSITDIPSNVWNFTSRTLTSFSFDNTNYSKISEYVWILSPERNLTYYQVNNINPSDIWNYMGSRNLTYTEHIDMTNYTQIQNMINNIPDKTNYTEIQNLLNQLNLSDKTNYTLIASFFVNQSDLTNYTLIYQLIENQSRIDMTNYSKVAEYVWFYTDRNLTTYPIGNNITVSDIWNYYNRSLSEDIPMQIWNYPNRNLTIDIPFEVWSYYNRTLTYYTLNLTDILNMIQDYEYDEIPIPFITPSPTGIISNQ